MNGLPSALEPGAAPEEQVIAARSLLKCFGPGETPALAGLDVEFAAGKITGLVGPDGAGKTTLLRLCCGLLLPDAGTVRVLGKDPGKDVDALRKSIGYMPQKFGLYEDLTVLENLNLYADLKGLIGASRRDAFERLLHFTDLEAFTKRLGGQLSGGMKQKLGLACTLLGTPRLLLLDEPGVGVDPISRRDLWKMVHNLVAQGLSVLWSTAYLDEAEICDQVILLHRGRALFTGAPGELRNAVRDRVYTLRNLKESPRAALRIARRDPSTMDGTVQGRGVRLLARPGAHLDPYAYGLERGATLAPAEPRFEDGFIDLLGGTQVAESPLAEAMKKRPLDGMTVIETHQLTKQFGNFVAANQVTLSVRRGEVFGLLGPNGAGKSTTFKMLCGLLAPTSGTARVAGVDLRSARSAARQKLGYMAQKFSLYGHLSVRHNLEFFAGAYGLFGKEKRAAIERMVESFDFQHQLDTKASELALGHKQRLALACAVLHGPEVLFLDEPTSGVDPLTRREFWSNINAMVERGVTVLVTTHFMDEAEYCDRIALISRGNVVALGSPDELKETAESPTRQDPSMEDAFIFLVQQEAQKETAAEEGPFT